MKPFQKLGLKFEGFAEFNVTFLMKPFQKLELKSEVYAEFNVTHFCSTYSG